MNLREEKFCEYYLGKCQGNGELAAIKAGYSDKCARQTAYKLLQRVHIQQYMAQRSSELVTNNTASIQEIQEFWTKIMNDPEEMMKNRIRVSELLAKAKGMFNNEW